MTQPIQIDDFAKAISLSRFKTYLVVSSGDKQKAYELYAYNIMLSKSFYVILNCWEIVLRNSIDTELMKIYGSDWIRDKNFRRHAGFRIISKIDETISKHTIKKIIPRREKVISDLSLSIWINLLSPKFWKYFGYYRSHWYNKADIEGMRPENIYKICSQALILRNRIAHHEPILGLENLNELYDQLLSIIQIISEDNAIHVKNFCDFKSTFVSDFLKR